MKIKINSLEEESSQSADYIARLETETGIIPELSNKLEKQSLEINALSEAVQVKDEENEQLNSTVNNLQSVIDDNQVIVFIWYIIEMN